MIKRSAEIEVTSNIKNVAKDLDDLEKKIDELVASQSKLSKDGNDWTKLQDEIDSLNSSYSKQKTEIDKLTGSNKNLFKSTLDNGGAMGLLNDLTGGVAMTVKDAVEASDLFSGSMKGWKAALISSGIGILVVLLGTVIAYWDDIKGAVDGVSSSQKEQLELTKQNVAASESKLETLSNQDNILKQQGKSEREILKIKAAQTAEVIKNVELQLQQEKAQLKAQVAAAKRNQEILSGMLNWLNIPLRLILMTIDGVGDALGLNFNLVDKLDAKTKSIRDKAAGLIFNADDVAKEGEKTIAETEKKLNNLKNQKAGFENSITEIDKQAALDKAAKSKEAQDELDAEKKKNDDAYLAQKKKLEDELQNVKDVSEQQKLNTQKARDEAEINALKDKSDTEIKILKDLLDERYTILQDKLDKENKLKEEKKQEEIQSVIDGNTVKKTLNDAQNLEELTAIYNKLQAELDAKQAAQLQDLINKGASDAQVKALQATFDQQDLDLKQQFSDAKSKIDDIDEERQKKKVAAIGQTLATAASLLGEHTLAGKALAIAATTIDTFQSSVSAYKGMVAAIPGPVGVAAGAVAAAAAIASGLATVKKIVSVKVPIKGGAGAGGAAGATPTAPARPSVSFTNTEQTQIGDTVASATQNRNSEPIKAYITVGDVNSAQALDRQIVDNAKF